MDWLDELRGDLREIRGKLDQIAVRLEGIAERIELRGDPGPVWSCGHRHRSRAEAIACKRQQRPVSEMCNAPKPERVPGFVDLMAPVALPHEGVVT